MYIFVKAIRFQQCSVTVIRLPGLCERINTPCIDEGALHSWKLKPLSLKTDESERN